MVKNRFGAMALILGKDMVTIEEKPKIIVQGVEYLYLKIKFWKKKQN